VSYYHDERGISAGQLLLLSKRMCACCSHQGVVVEVMQAALPPGVKVLTPPMQASTRPQSPRASR
jgi:hypothetical protein